MKKIFYISILAFFIASNALIGQVSQGIYNSSLTPIPHTILSAISLTDPVSEITYMVGTDQNLNVFVTELDCSSPSPAPTPVNTNSKAFNMNNATEKIYIKDGFFDIDGNIVVYGYTSETDKYGIVIKITMSTGVPTSVKYSISSVENSQIIDGCWSRASTYIPKTYSFITATSKGTFFLMNANTLTNMFGKTFADNNDYMSSVSWDDDSKQHIISGFRNIDTYNTKSLSLIVGYYNWGMPPLYNGAFQLFTTTNYVSSEFSNKHVLASNGFYYDGIVLLCQDIRANAQDGLWITQYDYYNEIVNSSNAYMLPGSKASIIDVGHDFMHFFVLGDYNGFIGTNFFERRYIAQFSLYNPNSYIAKRLNYVDIGYLTGSSYYKRRQAFQSCINYNIGSFDIFSTGSTIGKAYITKAIDLNYDDCDNTEMTLTPANISYVQSSVTANAISSDGIVSFPNSYTQNTSSDYPLSMGVICLTGGGKNNAKASFVETLINEKRSQINNTAKIDKLNSGTILTNNNNEFVCEKFEGECYYKVYNVFGSLIREGKTENGKINYLSNLTAGTYIIKVVDSKGNISGNKVVITK